MSMLRIWLAVSTLASGGMCFVACNAESSSSNAAEGSGGTTANSTSSGTSAGFDQAACSTCGEQKCAEEAQACDDEPGCQALVECMFACDQDDPSCALSCAESASSAGTEGLTAGNYWACAIASCANECVPSATVATSTTSTTSGPTPTTTGANTTTTNPTTTSGPAPTTTGANTTTTNPTTTSGPAPTTTGSSTTGTITPNGVTWLTFEDDWADPELGDNGALGISGSLYAYGDGCASISWDPATRCVSGTLCDPGPDFANWGMAVGFDFHNTGELGDPPDTKMAWDAASVGATGVAWSVSGVAPGLQAWITNMDPTHNGQCSLDECAIDGPPDGTPTAGSGSGVMLFSEMVKDDWGGSGTAYVFSSSSILALQFKLASVVSGAASYDFCIDEIGIVQ